MKIATSVQNLTGKIKVLFTSSGIFIFTCYFFHELELYVVPTTLSYWLLIFRNQDSRGNNGKRVKPHFGWAGSLHIPHSSLFQSNPAPKGWPRVMGWDRLAGEGTWDVHRWSRITSWTHCMDIISKHRNEANVVKAEGDDRGWEGWMPSPTWRTWVWVSSGSW